MDILFNDPATSATPRTYKIAFGNIVKRPFAFQTVVSDETGIFCVGMVRDTLTRHSLYGATEI